MPAIALLPLVAAGWMTVQQPDPPASVLDAAQVAVTEALEAVRATQVEVTIFNVNFPETVTFRIGRDGAIDDATRAELERTFKCKRTKRRHAIDRGLLVMLADVAARYPGKTIEYVSAYRAVDPRESRHRQGRAFDFRIPGVPLTSGAEVPQGTRDDLRFLGDAIDAAVAGRGSTDRKRSGRAVYPEGGDGVRHAAGADMGGEQAEKKENVVDAEFEEVKDDKKKD